MATPRKHWSKLADSVWREPWPLEVKGLFLNLHCFLNERWARDQLEPEEAGSVVLSPELVNALTGSKHLRRGRRLLEILSNFVSISVQYSGNITSIHWPKYPEFQGYRPRESPPPTPAPSPSYSSSSKKRRSTPLNLISKLPGSTREKELWWEDQQDAIDSATEVLMEEKGISRSVAFRNVIQRFYRWYTNEDEHRRPFAIKAASEVAESKKSRPARFDADQGSLEL